MEDSFKYVEERLENQKNWHSKKATLNKTRYYIFEIIMLSAGALIPVINVIDDISMILIRILSAGLASISVLAAGISKLYQFQENWLTFRLVTEALEREKELFLHQTGEYDQKNEEIRQKLLVERVENLISATTAQYFSRLKGKREKS